MTGMQTAMLQAAYASFQAGARLSIVNNPGAQGLLPDGSRYTIDCVNGSCTCVVWTAGSEYQEAGDSGILVFEPSSVTGQTLLIPGGKYSAPDGKWRVERDVDRRYAGLFGSNEGRPHWTVQSWHSTTGKEYYAREDESFAERAGKRALYGLSSEGVPTGAPFVTSVGGAKKLAVMFLSQERVFVRFGEPENTAPGAQGLPKPLRETFETTVTEVLPPDVIRGAAIHPGGKKALVTVGKNTAPPEPAMGVPYLRDRADEWYLLRHATIPGAKAVATLQRAAQTQYAVLEHQLLPTGDWGEGSAVFTGSTGHSSTKSEYVRTAFNNTVRLGGAFGISLLQAPVTTFVGPDGSACSYPSPMFTALEYVTSGPTEFHELQQFTSGDVLWGDDMLRYKGGVWYQLGGAAAILPVRHSIKHEGRVSSVMHRELWARYSCLPVVNQWGRDSSALSTTIESGTIERSVKKTTTMAFRGADVVVRDIDVREHADFSVDLRASTNDYTTFTDTRSVTVSLEVSVAERDVLVADPQFGLLCYVLSEYSYERSASATSTAVDEGYGTAYTYTGGDFGEPPPRPTAKLVIEFFGGKVFDVPVPPPEGEALQDFVPGCDCILHWVAMRRQGGTYPAGGLGSIVPAASMGEYARATPLNYPKSDMLVPLGAHEIGTLAVDGAIALSGADRITARYAKDPRTGAGLLHVFSTTPGSQPFFRAFVIDSTGVRPLAAIDDGIDPSTITGIAPT